MRYPSASAYQEAVQFPASAFVDPELQAAEPDENALGLPQVVSGAFAVVFSLRRAGMRWAVKCFLTEAPDQAARYRAVSRHLARHPIPAVVGFEYQLEGIRVDGRVLPVLKMEWIDGVPLNRFVAEHRDRPGVLAALAEQWAALLEQLEAAAFAHGDLQHGNVLVTSTPDGYTLRLVDYDTAFVPMLKGRKSPEIGHRNYQHPDRTEADFGPHLDRFAGLVVYTALRASIARPGLWDRYDTGENLLFRAADFYDPAQSPLFSELAEIEALRPLVEHLRRACYVAPEAVPPLRDVLDQAAPAPLPLRLRRRRAPVTAPRDAVERLFLPGVVAGILVAVGLLAAGLPLAMMLWAAVVAGGAVAASFYRYRSLPAVRRRRRLYGEVDYLDRLIAELEAQRAARLDERRAYERSQSVRLAERLREVQEQALEHHLKHHFVAEANGFEGITHKVVVRLKAAGIRTAFHATPDRVGALTALGDQSKASVAAWRAALVARYADGVPSALSPAEMRRFERSTRQHLDALDAEAARLGEKIAVQQAEREQIEQRLAAVPAISYGRYLRYLLRLSRLPVASSEAPPPPAPVPPPERPAQPVRQDEAGPWWKG